jgi:SAM-dependent methyltransferase
MCCGPGRHSVELAKVGRVTAVDRTPFLLDKARERASSAAAEIEFVQADMREFARPNAFDLAVNLFTSFGYFETREEDFRVLRNLAQSLKPGAVLVMEMVGKEILARQLKTHIWSEEQDGTSLLQIHGVNRNWSRLSNRWILIRGKERHEFLLEHNLYSGQELMDALKAAGFGSVDLFGSLDGTPYDHLAARLVAVARTPGS